MSGNSMTITLNGKEIKLIGTAHVSKESIEEVKNHDIIIYINGLARQPCWLPHKSCVFSGKSPKKCFFKGNCS
jgi:Uncharacterized homolog of PrgY (pheromone shutdown protein)